VGWPFPVLKHIHVHTATPDTTKLSRLCRVRFGGVNWIPGNSGLSPTENLKSAHVHSNRPIHTGTPDTTQTGLSCLVWCGGVNWTLLTEHGHTPSTAVCPALPGWTSATMKNTTILSQGQLQLRKKLD